MTGQDFKDWQKAMGWRIAETARQLGVTEATVATYRRDGTKVAIDLACAALYHRLKPWTKG